ncbi:gliding motility lipoprotein GldD [Winogradskyella maritima]|uniref:Gliding motility lipoprotein GldD n=1 Tax=Winogradskyella maritima TaxID=1517766 RepID=A0ABV8AD20_9FLAO|nr:gliding motility lipoprotein GldD [Winogradskyella maritima]
MKKLIMPLALLFVFSCGDDPVPKPSAYLRLDYPTPKYQRTSIDAPFTFEKNQESNPITEVKSKNGGTSFDVTIQYPKLKGTIYLTYKKVNDSNLIDLLRDAQTLTQKHTLKADAIDGNLFENNEKRVYGMFYEVGGNAASQSQFYATDSINHFLSGSLYFYAKPNYDSIYPAAVYLKNDIRRIMESLEWED